MPLILVLLFIVVPIAELYVIIAVVGEAIGPAYTILLLIADSLLGAYLLRSQGRVVWRRFNETLAQGRVPHREVLDGVLVIFGGALLLTPGFITDIFGIVLLIPPTRALVRRVIVRMLGSRLAVGVAGAAVRRGDSRDSRDYDVEGTATEYDDSAGELHR
jgi:UPF0716 protein FxsA